MKSHFSIILLLYIILQLSFKEAKELKPYQRLSSQNYQIIEQYRHNLILNSSATKQQYLFYCHNCAFKINDLLNFSALTLPPNNFLRADYKSYLYPNLVARLKTTSQIKLVKSAHKNSLSDKRNNYRKHISQFSANPLALALLAGDKTKLEHTTRTAFINTGTAHLLAISGLHVGGIALVFFFLSRKLLSLFYNFSIKYTNKKLAAFIGFSAAALFVYLANFPISGSRALFFITLLTIFTYREQKIANLNLLFFAVLCLLAFNPYYLFLPSFQLSFAAIIALAIYFKKFHKQERNYFMTIFFCSLAISIFTLPINLYHFGSSSLTAPFSNIIAIPYTSLLLMPAGLLAILGSYLASDFFFNIFDFLASNLINLISWLNNYALLLDNIFSINQTSLLFSCFALLGLLVSQHKKLILLYSSLFISSIIFANYLENKAELIISSNNKFFMVKDHNSYIYSDRKLAHFKQKKLTNFAPQATSFDAQNFHNDNLHCFTKFCFYRSKGKIISIIHRKLADKTLKQLCSISDLTFSYIKYQECKTSLTLNSYQITQAGTIFVQIGSKINLRFL